MSGTTDEVICDNESFFLSVSRCTVSELKSVEIQLDKESRFRAMQVSFIPLNVLELNKSFDREYLDGLDKLDPTPEKMPKSVMQLLFTRYDISPKFLDLIVAGNGGSIMGVSQFESTTKGSRTPGQCWVCEPPSFLLIIHHQISCFHYVTLLYPTPLNTTYSNLRPQPIRGKPMVSIHSESIKSISRQSASTYTLPTHLLLHL